MADYEEEMTPRQQQIMGYLASKRTSLSAPGTMLNSLYYDNYSSSVEAVECTFNTGRYINSLSSPTFGGSSTVILANNDFVGEVYLHLELPNIFGPTPSDPTAAQQTLSRGWGYGCIASIQYLVGNSSSSQVSLNGQSMWAKIAMQCDTAERRSEFFRLGGEEYLAPIMRVNASTGLLERDPDAVISADILLPMPWSSATGSNGAGKKAFDSSILSNPITITVAFDKAQSIYGGSTLPYPFPRNLNAASMIFRQGELRYKNMSLEGELKMNPDKSLFYPDIFCSYVTPPVFQGSQTQPISLPIVGILNGDLLSMTVAVVRTSQLESQPLLAPVNTYSAPNKFQFDVIQNVSLLFNGQVMFRAPRTSWKLFTSHSTPGAQFFHNSLIVPGLTAGTFTSVPQDAYLLHIDFSQFRSTSFESHFANTWRIGNNTLTLQFTTEGDQTVSYQCFVTLSYNSIVQIQSGNSLLYFD